MKRLEEENAICAHLITWLSAKTEGGKWLGFRGLAEEVDLSSVYRSGNLHRWAFPRMNGEELELFTVRDWARGFVQGRFGVYEPAPEQSQNVMTEDLSVVLVPGLAFDLGGNRLGRGKGFFDRFLRRLRSLPPTGRQAEIQVIGVGFRSQMLPSLEQLPVDPWDERVDFLLSPDGLVKADGLIGAEKA